MYRSILTLATLTLFASLTTIVVRAADDTPTSQPAIRIALAGDSTVALGSGWGPGFEQTLKPSAQCLNFARGGQSSKSFRDTGQWQKLLDSKPAYVLIQFGHNDQPGKGPNRETDPATTYTQNMTRFVEEARAIHATPILVTSIPRRGFGPDGKLRPDGLQPYVEAVKKVAAEHNVPLIDLHALNVELLNKLGPEATADWNPTAVRKVDGKDVPGPDHTHLTKHASQVVGQMVADELKKIAPELKDLLK